jgi:hypothetical protein
LFDEQAVEKALARPMTGGMVMRIPGGHANLQEIPWLKKIELLRINR